MDVSSLELYGAIHVSDLPHTGSIKFREAEETLVAHVTEIREEAATAEVSDAPAGGQPEVTKGKGKPEAQAATPAPNKPPGKK